MLTNEAIIKAVARIAAFAKDIEFFLSHGVAFFCIPYPKASTNHCFSLRESRWAG